MNLRRRGILVFHPGERLPGDRTTTNWTNLSDNDFYVLGLFLAVIPLSFYWYPMHFMICRLIAMQPAFVKCSVPVLGALKIFWVTNPFGSREDCASRLQGVSTWKIGLRPPLTKSDSGSFEY